MANATLTKFGDPAGRIADYRHWRILLRPAQITLGALILGHKGEERAFSVLPVEAFSELAHVTRDIETVLRAFVQYERINYLMLMMVDPHVHFHVLPRYAGERRFGEVSFADAGWPGPPDLSKSVTPDRPATTAILTELRSRWPQDLAS